MMSTLAPGERYDFVVYGATGFTGQFVLEEVARVAQMEKETEKLDLRWAVAGRSEIKLLKAIQDAKLVTEFDADKVGVILANNSDENSLEFMARQAKVVINCVGPYFLYGEPVVKACIAEGASHVDISGEPWFLDKMQLDYDEKAKEAGVHIVGACGYDSVPADMGLIHMIQNFSGEVNCAETYVQTRGGSGSSFNTGTMESAAIAISKRHEAAAIRRKLFPNSPQKSKFQQQNRGPLHHRSEINAWSVPFPTDEPVVSRTQRHRQAVLGQRMVQFKGYAQFPTFVKAFCTLLGMAYFVCMCLFSWTRNLIIKHPSLMTGGIFKREGHNRQALSSMTFQSTILGQGWKQKLTHGQTEYTQPPDATAVVKIMGPDPGYGATSLMLVACAHTILREKDNCYAKGGVMTPGTAFANTHLLKRLTNRGMKIEFCQN